VLAWRLGRVVSGGTLLGATAAATFALLGGVLSRVEGGLPRAWAMPVLLFGLVAVLEKRWILFGVALFATAVFYPPLIVNLGLLGAAVLGAQVARTRSLPRHWLGLALLGCAALVVLWFEYESPDPDPMGPRVTAAVARGMPEFGPEGRSHFFSPDPVAYYVTNPRSGLGLGVGKLIAICVALALVAWLLPRAIPREVWLIPVTALAAYAAAHATLFSLHLPSRYTRFALPAFMMLALAAIVPRVAESTQLVPAICRAASFVSRPRSAIVAAALALAVLATEAALALRSDLAKAPPKGYPDLVGFLSALPADTLIGAHPTDASSIPLLARRSVLASEETSTPYELGYYARMKERVSAEIMAFYATDWTDVDALHGRFGVSVFVVDLGRYRRPIDLERVYFEPFRSEARELVRRGERIGFVLENPPPDRVLFRAGDHVVVRVKAG
jgi:hypothetical protein